MLKVTTKTSFALTRECLDLLAALATRFGIAKSAVLEVAVREYARREGVVLDMTTGKQP